MADLKRLEAAFMKADRANDTRAASVLAAEIKRLRGTSAPAPVANRRPAQTAAPLSSRQATQVAAQQQIKKKREEERGFFGELYDSVFGADNTTPKALTETQQSTRITDIAAERQRLLTQAAELEARARITPGRIDRGPDQAQALRDAAQRIRASADALGNQAAFITKTGVEAPKPSFVRETLGAAPREFTRGVVSLPGVIEEFAGRGLSMVGAPGGEYLTKTGQADQAAASKLAGDIFGAPSEDLQYDPTTQLATDVSGGLGSMATFAIPGGAARIAGAGKGLTGTARAQAIAKASLPGQYGIATVQGAGQGAEDIRAYEQRTGEKVSDAAAFATMLLNAGLGAAEVGVFNRLVERIPVAQRGAAMEKVAETVRRVSRGKVDPTTVAKAVGKELTDIQATALGRVAVGTLEEATQEGGVQLGSNVIAKGLYDEERDLTQGVGQAALVGGIVGGGVRGGVEATQKLLGSTPAAAGVPPPPPSSRTPAAAPPPADMGDLVQALGPVGGKINLQDAFGPQEYTFQGFDKKGKVILTDADGVTLSEDPEWVRGAIGSAAVESEEGLGGMAFSSSIEEDVAAPPPPPPPPPPTTDIGSNRPKFTIDPVSTTGDEFVSNILDSKPVAPSVFSTDTDKPKFTIEPAPAREADIERDAAFRGLASAQRGEPEDAMVAAQRDAKTAAVTPGYNSYTNLLENVGDLTNRMANPQEIGATYGKIESALVVLKNEADAANLANIPLTPQIETYAAAHAKLPVYNEAQRLARDAAVALGRKDFETARTNLTALKEMKDNGSLEEESSKYDPNFETQAAPPPPAAPTADGAPVKLVPYENMAMSAMWYSGGSQTAVAGAKKPAWVPDDVIQYDIPGRPRPTGDQSDVRVEKFTAKDGTIGTQVSVIVPSVDEVYGDRGNTAAVTVWLRGAEFVDPTAAAETLETIARWVADPKNNKKSDGPLNKFANDALQFMAKSKAVTVGPATPAAAVAAPPPPPPPTPASPATTSSTTRSR